MDRFKTIPSVPVNGDFPSYGSVVMRIPIKFFLADKNYILRTVVF
jgi:hypothetical protein